MGRTPGGVTGNGDDGRRVGDSMRHMRHATARRRRAAAWEATRKATWNFTAEEVGALQSEVLGRVVTPSDDSYPVDRQAYVPNFQHYPQLIVFCEVERDAQAALAFAIAHELPVAVRSSGHSTAGFSVNDGLVIDVAGLNDVYVHADGRHVTVGAGTNFGKLNAVLQPRDLHVPGGGCSEVCVAGYMQGGGYGLTSLIYGMNCDRVTSMRVLLADGRIVDVDATRHPDLFWAIRGGRGNNFGVLLQVTYELVELDEFWGFDVNVELDHAPVALAWLERHWAGPDVPEGLGWEGLLTFLPHEKGGEERPLLTVRGVVRGGETHGRSLLGPLLEVESASLRFHEMNTYEYLNSFLLDSVPLIDDGSRTVTDSRFVDEIGEAGWSALCDLFGSTDMEGNFIGLEPYGGAIASVGRTDTAYVHRDARFDVFSWVFWFDEDEERASRAWLERFTDLLDELGNGEAYQNYPNRQNARYAEMYWAENYARLQQIRADVDPTNVFGYPQSVRLPDSGDDGGPT